MFLHRTIPTTTTATTTTIMIMITGSSNSNLVIENIQFWFVVCLFSVNRIKDALSWLSVLGDLCPTIDALRHHRSTDCYVFFNLQFFNKTIVSFEGGAVCTVLAVNRIVVAYRHECAVLLHIDPSPSSSSSSSIRLLEAPASLGFTASTASLPRDFGAISPIDLPIILRRLYARWWVVHSLCCWVNVVFFRRFFRIALKQLRVMNALLRYRLSFIYFIFSLSWSIFDNNRQAPTISGLSIAFDELQCILRCAQRDVTVALAPLACVSMNALPMPNDTDTTYHSDLLTLQV